MSASSIFTSMRGHRQSSAAYGRLTVGTKPQRKCHLRINRPIAIANLLDRRKAMSNFRPLRTSPKGAPLFNPRSPEFIANPYPSYHLLRETEPMHYMPLGLYDAVASNDRGTCIRDDLVGGHFDLHV